MDKNRILILKNMFDSIVHTTEDGIEYWLARDLQSLLGYTKWDNFKNVVEKAKEACETSKAPIYNHFADIRKMVNAGVASKEINDIMLTRYACYLICQNGDPGKEEIAFAQSYFAVQTRKQELIEERIEYIQRNEARERLKTSEKKLFQNIYERGVDDAGFARIRSKGDQALFGGNTTQNMKENLVLAKADH